jgi:glyoxylase-like metal-dependent hydrolase (beta-lactamase superfamily II)
MIFRQLFDPETSSYSYLLADGASRDAVLIDPVLEQCERDVALLRELELRLRVTLETHVHADHVTGAGRLRETLGSRVGAGAATGVRGADLVLRDGELVRFGRHALEVRATPGHTRGCVSYVHHGAGLAFTGDALLVRGCGRTDFQEGDARTLFRSVRERLLTLPDEVLLYPGHDYKGRTVTTVGEEKRWNARLGLAVTEDAFVAIMADLRLAYPKRIDVAVPANLACGTAPEPPDAVERRAAPGPVAGVAEQLGRQDADVWSGLGI